VETPALVTHLSDLSRRQAFLVLSGVLLGILLAALDQTIVGTAMVLFTIIVQNAVAHRVMGVATAALTFFRAIGGTLGTAIFGSFLAGAFAAEFSSRLPAALQNSLPTGQLARIQPEALLNPEAMNQVQTLLAQSGVEGPALLSQLLEAIRGALAASIHQVFLAGALVMAAAAVLCVLLREAPLRRSVRDNPALVSDGGPELQ
jgi:hypothetical protein